MGSQIKFYLKEPNKNSETLLLCRVYNSRSDTFKKTTGIKLHPKDWNTEKQVIKKTNPHSKELNLLIQQIKSDYTTHSINANLQGNKLTKTYLNSNSKYSKQKGNTGTYFDVWDTFVSSKKNLITEATVKRYNVVKNHLLEFEKCSNYKLAFNTVNLAFYQLFTDYLINVKGFHNQHLSRVLKFVKSFQNYTFENGFHNNIDFKKFKLFKDNADEIISLEIEEIKAIEELQNPNNYIINARDLFLFLCYTGLRFSDLKQINGNKIKEGFISVLTQKTKQNVLIPVHPRLAALVKKYTVKDVIKLHLISNVKLNAYLKEIGQLIGLNVEIKKVRFTGTSKTEITKKKWELLTTHTGKRTFITIAILSGIPIEVIKKITGNKDDATFIKYQRFSNEQLKKEMQSWNK